VIATHGRGIWIIDDISPLRSLNAEVLNKEIAFVQARAPIQPIPAYGGWANGDASFVGPNPPSDAVITYYQKKRHIFGDLKMEVFGQDGKSLGAIQSSKRRGLNRTTWSMRLKAPRVPSGATGVFGAAVGPRVLPGSYTIKLTKDKNVYTTVLKVTDDPRSKHTLKDRKEQMDLIMKVYRLLEDMTFTVDQINGVRSSLDDRAAKLRSNDPLADRLTALSLQADEFRKKIVATKEGGMITGEERLREFAANLYGDLNSYEGRPSQTQVQRADALTRELADLVKDLGTWNGSQLRDIGPELAKAKLEPITLLTRDEWEAKTGKK